MSNFTQRMGFALNSAFWHLLVSAVVAGALGVVVFFVWYPPYLQGIVGGLRLYGIVIMVDVVCGPLLTLILASPKKTLRARLLDYSLVGCVQIAALAYGLHMVFVVRPVAVVFEVDRFVVVRPADIRFEELGQAPEQYQALPWSGPFLLSVRRPKDGDELLESLEQSMAGFEPSARPSWWLDYDERARAQVRERAKPLANLIDSSQDADVEKIKASLDAHKYASAKLYYLPLTAPSNYDWVVVLDEQMSILDSVEVSGW